MPLRSGLAVYCYSDNGSVALQNISALIENLTFSTVAPGGFGQLTALVVLKSAKVPRPQFGLFSRIAVMDGPMCVWLGELSDPAYGLDATNGDYIKLTALGLGNALRDAPRSISYTASYVAQNIAQAWLTYYTSTTNILTGVISTDNSQLFPDNPATSLQEDFDGRTFEEMLADISLLAGDYDWGVEADPLQKDFAGFPLGRIFARKRDLTSVGYTASLQARDVLAAEFSPTASRAYNAIAITYNNGTSGVGTASATDSRLSGTLGQGTAPFRYRLYQRDVASNSVVNATIAQSIANTYLALFKNPTYSGTASLRGVRDANGNRLPLWQAQAGANLYVPELAIQGAQLPTSATQNTNLFWIAQATYREDTTGNQSLDLQLGYLPDWADVQIARLQMASDALARSARSAGKVAAQGATVRGQYAWAFSNAIAGDTVGGVAQFPLQLYQAPTSLTLSGIIKTNLGTLSVTDFTAVGAFIYSTAAANGAGAARGTYTTNGNCLRHVDPVAHRFAHHCDVCDTEHRDLSLEESDGHVVVARLQDAVGLSVVCPRCAAEGRDVVESFNTALTAQDEAAHEQPWRAEQARLIRQLMAAHGLALR